MESDIGIGMSNNGRLRLNTDCVTLILQLRKCIIDNNNKDMGSGFVAQRSSDKKKSIYQLKREELGLSREKASELLESLPPERIERLESGKFTAHPDEIMIMADKYGAPELCNYYCANECEIGRQYVPEIKIKNLSQIVLEMLASLNSVKRRQDRLIEITADGLIDDDEVEDFLDIQEDLEKISITVETLQLWSEQKLASGKINLEAYNAAKQKRKK